MSDGEDVARRGLCMDSMAEVSISKSNRYTQIPALPLKRSVILTFLNGIFPLIVDLLNSRRNDVFPLNH